jgi:hypothetical protein
MKNPAKDGVLVLPMFFFPTLFRILVEVNFEALTLALGTTTGIARGAIHATFAIHRNMH